MDPAYGITPAVMIFAFIFAFFFFVLFSLIPVIIFWKICSKAGFPGALGLLMLVPVANFLLPLYIAFADWPALEEKSVSDKD